MCRVMEVMRYFGRCGNVGERGGMMGDINVISELYDGVEKFGGV